MSEALDFDNGSESVSDIVNITNSESMLSDIIYESNMTDMDLQAEDVGR